MDYITVELNKHLAKKDREDKEYQTMLDEIDNAIGVELLDIMERFDKIVNKHGFFMKLDEYLRDEL